MNRDNDRARRTLELAERVQSLLSEHGIDAALIGALACAVYRYSRATEDVDLAVYADPVLTLPSIVRALAAAGFQAKFARPDAEDPLGGVITVRGRNFDPIQVVNFYNPLSGVDNPGWESIQQALPVAPGRLLRVVRLPHLIALKLYAGGSKSRLDVMELLERNMPLELDDLRATCGKYGLADALEAILRELGLP